MSVQAHATRRHLDAATYTAALGDVSPWYDAVDEVPYEYVVDGLDDGDDVEARLLEQRVDEYIKSEDPDGAELARLQAERERFEAQRSERLAAVRVQVEQSPLATCWVRMGVPVARVTRAVFAQCAMALHVLACEYSLFVEHPTLDAFLCAPALCDASLAAVAVRSTSRSLTAERNATAFVLRVKAKDPLPFVADLTTGVVIGADARRTDPRRLLPGVSVSTTQDPEEPDVPPQHLRTAYLKRVYDTLLVGVAAFLASCHPACDDDTRPLVLGWCKAIDRLVRPLLRAYADKDAVRAACTATQRAAVEACLGDPDPLALVRFLGARTTAPWLADPALPQHHATLVRAEHEAVWAPLLARVQATLRSQGKADTQTCLFEGQWSDYFDAGAVRPANVSFVSLLSLGWISLALSTQAFEQRTQHDASSIVSFDNPPIPGG